jgi:small basic protein (TIGR04137 family)
VAEGFEEGWRSLSSIVVGQGLLFQAGNPLFARCRGLARSADSVYDTRYIRSAHGIPQDETMSIDKSLRRKNSLERSRNVLTRGERIKVLQDEERWKDGRSPYGLPKVRVLKIAKKVKKAPKEEAAATEEAAPDKKGDKKADKK